MAIADWLPPLSIGVCFSTLGSLKLWGLNRGIVGGADKPLSQRLCGT